MLSVALSIGSFPSTVRHKPACRGVDADLHVYFPPVSVFMFDYVASIISYSLVGVAIFSGRYDGYTPIQLSSVVSKVSTVSSSSTVCHVPTLSFLTPECVLLHVPSE